MIQKHQLKQIAMLIGTILLAGYTETLPKSSESVSLAQSSVEVSGQPLPVTDVNGNYRRSGHRTWQVVDDDPNGLNCRWSRAMPVDWYSPATQFPDQNFGQWPVVRRFPTGTTLTANLSPAGFEVFYDARQRPWLKVSLGDNEQICLVRANAAYIQPIPDPVTDSDSKN